LLLAVAAVPLFREILLFETDCVEPLSLAVGVLAGDHFSKRGASTKAVLIFRGLIVEVFFFVGLDLFAGIQLIFFPLQDLLLWAVFVFVFKLN